MPNCDYYDLKIRMAHCECFKKLSLVTILRIISLGTLFAGTGMALWIIITPFIKVACHGSHEIQLALMRSCITWRNMTAFENGSANSDTCHNTAPAHGLFVTVEVLVISGVAACVLACLVLLGYTFVRHEGPQHNQIGLAWMTLSAGALLALGVGLLYGSLGSNDHVLMEVVYAVHKDETKCSTPEIFTLLSRDMGITSCALVLVSGLVLFMGHHIYNADNEYQHSISTRLTDNYSRGHSWRSHTKTSTGTRGCTNSVRSHQIFKKHGQERRKISTSLPKDCDIVAVLPAGFKTMTSK